MTVESARMSTSYSPSARWRLSAAESFSGPARGFASHPNERTRWEGQPPQVIQVNACTDCLAETRAKNGSKRVPRQTQKRKAPHELKVPTGTEPRQHAQALQPWKRSRWMTVPPRAPEHKNQFSTLNTAENKRHRNDSRKHPEQQNQFSTLCDPPQSTTAAAASEQRFQATRS